MTRLIFAIAILAMVSGCARVRDSAANPFNWFGQSRSAPVVSDDTGAANPLIPRRRSSVFTSEADTSYQGALVSEVTELRVDRAPGGAIVKASGTSETLGAFDVRLVRDRAASSGGTLVYELRALSSSKARGSTSARSVTAAVSLSNQALAGISTIQVKSASNVRTVRR
ncbi:hypothetical protein ACS3SW_02345 [Roseobacteraceae bacterium S113]